jgi:hypothetical protein
MANTIEISPGRFLQITGYIGTLENNVFQRIPESQISANKLGDDWNVNIKLSNQSTFQLTANLSFIISKKNNSLIIDKLVLESKAKVPDITATIMAVDPKEPFSLILFDGSVKAFKPVIIELPAVNCIKLEDFAASIATSFKKAQENIAKKLGKESFVLEIEDFEIKTPYIAQMSDDENLMMRLPVPGETINPEEQMFAKLRFRKTIKLE